MWRLIFSVFTVSLLHDISAVDNVTGELDFGRVQGEATLILPQTWRNDPGSLRGEEDPPLVDPLAGNFRVTSLSLDSSKVRIFKPRPSGRCRRDSTTSCGEVCHCINRRRYCCRQRKDWDSLSGAEKELYLRTVRNLATGALGQGLRYRYEQLLRIHEQQWYTIIHTKGQFFPWHRIYLLKFENLLRVVDCTITIPYWDWTKSPGHWWQQDVFGSYHFGSNFFQNGGFSNRAQCPSNGYFASWTGFRDLEGRCLQRQFSYHTHPAGYSRIQHILRMTNFHQFESALRYEHGVPHFMVGGDGNGLFFTSRAAEDPLFFLHHSNVEFQWYQRQVRPPKRNFAEFWSSRSSTSLIGFKEKIGQAVNPFKQGKGRVCVEYVENDTRYQDFMDYLRTQGQVGNLESCKGKQSSSRFPSSIFTLFKTPRREREEFLAERNKAFC